MKIARRNATRQHLSAARGAAAESRSTQPLVLAAQSEPPMASNQALRTRTRGHKSAPLRRRRWDRVLQGNAAKEKILGVKEARSMRQRFAANPREWRMATRCREQSQ